MVLVYTAPDRCAVYGGVSHNGSLRCVWEAGVVKLVDTRDLGSRAFGVGVQVPPPAPTQRLQNDDND